MLDSLPLELLLMIISYLHLNSDLFSVCLASRSLYDVAHPFLYKLIELGQLRRRKFARSALLLKQLIYKPELARLTKKLVLSYRTCSGKAPPETPLGNGYLDEWFQEAKRLGLVPSTETRKKKRGNWGAYLSKRCEHAHSLLIAAMLPRLEELHFDQTYMWPSSYYYKFLCQVPHNFPHLQQLTFTGQNSHACIPLIRILTVHILSIAATKFHARNFVDWNSPIHSNITALLLLEASAAPESLEQLMDCFPRLETLAIRHLRSIRWAFRVPRREVFSMNDLMRILRKRRDTLKHLQLYTSERVPSLAEFDKLRVLELYAHGEEYEYTILPASLRTLHLVNPNPKIDVLSWSAEVELPSHLKLLQLRAADSMDQLDCATFTEAFAQRGITCELLNYRQIPIEDSKNLKSMAEFERRKSIKEDGDRFLDLVKRTERL